MKIALVNMPFADANRPSLSLTQLQSRVTQLDSVQCSIHYLNQDCTILFGPKLFKAVADQYLSGLGDWLFRHLAFSNAPENRESYFARHFPFTDPKSQSIKANLEQKRQLLNGWLDKMIDEHQLDQADIVGFSSMFSQNVASFALARKLKMRNPHILTAIGGANCETPMGQEIARHVPWIDFVFSGPGLVSFPEMIANLLEGDGASCHQIPGVFSKKNVLLLETKDLAGKELPMSEDISLDYQSFIDTFDSKFPTHGDTKLLTFETSRGCWWGERSHCTFCGLNSQSMGYRSMPPENARQLLSQLFTYADRCQHFSCVDNILPKNYVTEVFSDLDVPDHIDIFYEVKADLTEAELALLSEKRVKRVQPGIEALATKTLKLMRKGTTAFGNINFLKLCRQYDVVPEWNLLVGFPGETEDIFLKYAEDLPILVHLPPPGGCYPVRFDRYSPYFTDPTRYGLHLKPYDFYKDVYHGFSEASLNNLAYYFQDTNYRADYSRTMLRYLDSLRGIVAHWIGRWSGRDGDHPPSLYFKRDDLVVDTRLGSERLHYLSEAEALVLKSLSTPKAVGSLSGLDPKVSGYLVEDALTQLQRKKLLFKEGKRYLSLVMPCEGSVLVRRYREEVHAT